MAESDAVACGIGCPNIPEKAAHRALYAWRLTAQNDFAPLSQKGAGTLAYASVARVHDGMLPEEDLLPRVWGITSARRRATFAIDEGGWRCLRKADGCSRFPKSKMPSCQARG